MRARSERSAVRTHLGVLRAIDSCIALARDPAACVTRAGMVSRWSVGEHLEHLLLSDSAIVEWLEGVSSGSVSGALHGGLTFRGPLVLRTGFIPRGKGRAPELTVPAGLSSSEIETGFRHLRRRFEALGSSLPSLAEAKATRRHPVLGHFTPTRWIRFAHVHHGHHDKIITEILRAIPTV